MNYVDVFVIGLGTFMVCFYVVHVMKDWGLIQEESSSEKSPKIKK